jgi:hypothetical protein
MDDDGWVVRTVAARLGPYWAVTGQLACTTIGK